MEKDWSQLAENFDEYQRYITGEATDKIIKGELSKLRNTGNLLEFGCGIGNYTKILSGVSKSILATDISDDMVRVAKEKLKDFSNVKVETANCYGTNFEKESYDTIFMANLIHVVKEPSKALNESYRLLKSDGKLIILSFTVDGMSFPNIIKMIFRYLRTFGKPPKGGTPFKLKTLKEFIDKHGFKVERSNLLGDKQSKAMFVIASKVSK